MHLLKSRPRRELQKAPQYHFPFAFSFSLRHPAARVRREAANRGDLIERDTDPTRLSPDNVTMVIAVLCVDSQVE